MKFWILLPALVLAILLAVLASSSVAAPLSQSANEQSVGPPFDPVEVVLNADSHVPCGAEALASGLTLEGPKIEVANKTDDDEITPAVAYSTQSHQYLVVYEAPCALGASCISGTYLDTGGQVLASVYLKDRMHNHNPDVAYDPIHNRFAVVWESY